MKVKLKVINRVFFSFARVIVKVGNGIVEVNRAVGHLNFLWTQLQFDCSCCEMSFTDSGIMLVGAKLK